MIVKNNLANELARVDKKKLVKRTIVNVCVTLFLCILLFFFLLLYVLEYEEKNKIASYISMQSSKNESALYDLNGILNRIDSDIFEIIITDCGLQTNYCNNQKIIATQNNNLTVEEVEGLEWLPLISYNDTAIRKVWYGNELDRVIGRVYFAKNSKYTKMQIFFNIISKGFDYIFFVKEKEISGSFRQVMSSLYVIFGFLCCMCFIWIVVGMFGMDIYYLKSEGDEFYYKKSLQDLIKRNEELIEDNNILEEKQKKLILDNKDIFEKYRYIANYATANNLTLQNELIAPMNNQIQILNAIISGLQNRVALDIRDFLHDIRKTPWLKYVSDTEDFKAKIFTRVELNKLGKFADDLDNSKKSMAWLTSNIQHLTELSLESVNVVECIADFKDNLPPTILKSDRNNVINFNGLDKIGLFVSANFYHIQAIMKNAIYNSTAQFEKIRSKKEYRRNPNVFQGVIDVDCGVFDDDFIYISIADNGGGISNELMEKIYESFDKVNPNSEAIRGNGSILVTSFLAMYGGKAIKANTEQGFEVKFLFKKVKGE